MKQIITLSAVAALFALVSSGCSDLNSPTGPSEISAISFPQDATGENDFYGNPVAPSNLEATLKTGGVKLSWKYSATDEMWFRVYIARDASGFELFRATPHTTWQGPVSGNWTKLIFQVTAVDSRGHESNYSAPVVVYRDLGEEPKMDTPQDDAWN